MSQENVEIVERAEVAYAAFNQLDWDAFFADMYSESDYEWEPVEENASYRGRQAVIGYLEGWLEVWDEFRTKPEE